MFCVKCNVLSGELLCKAKQSNVKQRKAKQNNAQQSKAKGDAHAADTPPRLAHPGEHLLHVESSAHAQGPEAPPLIGPLRAATLLRPVGVAVHAHQRNVGAEKVARRQYRSIPTH